MVRRLEEEVTRERQVKLTTKLGKSINQLGGKQYVRHTLVKSIFIFHTIFRSRRAGRFGEV